MRAFFTDMLAAAASIAVTAGCVAMAAPAAAADVDAPRQMTVATHDLNLNVPAGRAAADHRIRSAANTVCATGDPRFPVDGACRGKAIAQATDALSAQVRAAAPAVVASR